MNSINTIKEFFGIRVSSIGLDEDHDGIADHLQYKIVELKDTLKKSGLSKQNQEIQQFIEEILHYEIDEDIKWTNNSIIMKINPPCSLQFYQCKKMLENNRIVQQYFYVGEHSESLMLVNVLDDNEKYIPDIQSRIDRKNMMYANGTYTEGNPEDHATLDNVCQTMLIHLPILHIQPDGTLDGSKIKISFNDGMYILTGIISHDKKVEYNDLLNIEACSTNITGIRIVCCPQHSQMLIHVQLRSNGLRKRLRDDV